MESNHPIVRGGGGGGGLAARVLLEAMEERGCLSPHVL